MVNRRGWADRTLSAAAGLLPAEHREWAQAMRAELLGIERADERARFALGCLRAVLTRPAVLRTVGYPALMAAALVAIVGWSRAVAYPPLRWGLVAIGVVLVALAWLGRRPGLLGPVGDDPTARVMRAAGYLMVAAVTAAFVALSRSGGNPFEQAQTTPFVGVVLALYLTGFLSATADRPAPQVLLAAAGAGGGAATVWLSAALVAPPIPASAGAAIVLTLAAAFVAAYSGRGRQGSALAALLAAAFAAALASLLIVTLVVGLSAFGSASLIPDLAPAALGAADGLRQSRREVVDPYLAVLLLGCLPAALLTVVSAAARSRSWLSWDVTPAQRGE